MPLVIEKWLTTDHPQSYFANLSSDDDYEELCSIFDLNKKDPDSALAIEGFYNVYKTVHDHPGIQTSVIYRLHELQDRAIQAAKRAFGGDEGEFFVQERAKLCEQIHNQLLIDAFDGSAEDAAFNYAVALAQKMQGPLSAEDRRSMRKDFDAFIKKSTAIYPDVRSEIDALTTAFPEELNKVLNPKLSKAQMATLLTKIKPLIESGKPPSDIDTNIKTEIETLTGKSIDQYDSEYDAISDFTLSVVDQRDRGFTPLFKNCLNHFQYITHQSNEVTQYFGLNKKHHQLVSEGSVYAPQGIGHTRNINMVWMLANMHAERKFVVISEVSDANKHRRRHPEVISAFSSEIVAAKNNHYRANVAQDGKVTIHPPLPPGTLSTVTFAGVKQDMRDAGARASISGAYDEMKQEVEGLQAKSQTTSSNDLSGGASASAVQVHKEKAQEAIKDKSKAEDEDTPKDQVTTPGTKLK